MMILLMKMFLVTTENEIGDWLRNAKTPATYVAAGGFEQAASLLNKQIGWLILNH